MVEASKKKLILFSYQPLKSDVSTVKVNVRYGDSWNDLQGKNNIINTIFDKVDKEFGNGDGIIQANEVNFLNKLVMYIDHLKCNSKTNGNRILDANELKAFNKIMKKTSFDKLDIDTLLKENGCDVESTASEKPWSEGLDRNISEIIVSKKFAEKTSNKELIKKLNEIGQTEGFSIGQIYNDDNVWIEDSWIKRSDRKIYSQLYKAGNIGDTGKYTKALNTPIGQGAVNLHGYNFDITESLNNVEFGTSYLEGGNVLNACKTNGKAGAIVGEGSIAYTLSIMNLEPTEENISTIKKQIAQDLGLKEDDVTFIPQYDFHIDMLYRPLHNGEIAIPDFEEGIKILQETDLKSITPKDKQNKIKLLQKVAETTKPVREEAEKRLTDVGYKLVKIPNFSTHRLDNINFMNGVGGISTKTGKSFYITNESPYPELETIVEKYFHKAGVDNIYFVPTQDYLINGGGIDCLTQER